MKHGAWRDGGECQHECECVSVQDGENGGH